MSNWTRAEDDTLRHHFWRGSYVCSVLVPMHSWGAVKTRGHWLRLHCPKLIGAPYTWKPLIGLAVEPKKPPRQGEALRRLLDGPALATELPGPLVHVVELVGCLNRAMPDRHIVSRMVKTKTKFGWVKARQYELVQNIAT